ncbi:MAG: IS4 family transposase [bacterium]
MTNTQLFEELLLLLSSKTNDYYFLLDHRSSPTFFTRKGKFDFRKVLLMLLNFFKKSSSVEIHNFITGVLKDDDVGSRQAFEKARSKIMFTAFMELFNDSSKIGLSSKNPELLFGYRLFAIDGSTAMLEKSNELSKHFGPTTPSAGDVVARVFMCIDVLNGYVVDAEIGNYGIGERKMALSHIKKDICPNALYLYDRGYWSPELVSEMCTNNQKFLMRVPKNFSKSVQEAKETSGFFEIKYGKNTFKLRFHKFILKSGEEECLVTNLDNDIVADKELGKIYWLRWGIETKYRQLKSQLQLENFTGKSVLFVLQDFYAMLFLMNMIAFAKLSSDKIIDERTKDKNLKNECMTNQNIAIGILKDRFILAVLEDNPVKKKLMFDKIITDISGHVTIIRPNRHPPRKKSSIKYKRRTVKKTAL